MKVAIPTRGTVVDDHFGHCELYTVFTLDEKNNIKDSEIVPSPVECGCKSDIAGILRQKGVSVMLAGNMGAGAYNVLNYNGIQVYRGCTGNVRQVVEDYVSGKIMDSNQSCGSHEHHHGSGGQHQCSH